MRENTAPLNDKDNIRTFPHPSITFPIVIAEWLRNSREVVRVELAEYQGRHVIAVRTWYRSVIDGGLKPGRSGITLSIKHLPEMAGAVSKALARATALGLIGEKSGQQ